MFKKKITYVPLVDVRFSELYHDLCGADIHLRDYVKETIAKKGVIDLYPDGADKDRAIEKFEMAKDLLLYAMKHYDACKNVLYDYYENHKDEFIEYKGWTLTKETSDDIVIYEYQRLCLKN